MDVTPCDPKRPLIWDEAVLDLQEALAEITTPIYIVGGAVRDAYLHRPIKDIDLATPGDSIALARTIANRLRGDIFVLDAERGVGRALVDTPSGRLTLDVAQFRGADLLADLLDRDFTINAMAVDLHTSLYHLIDPLNAEQDISEKRLRRCSPSAIADDPLRALRAVRQSVQLKFQIDPDTLHDIRANTARLSESSPERLRDELVNLLMLATPAVALRVAEHLDLLDSLIPEIARLREIPHGAVNGWQHTLAVVESLTGILQAISPARTDYTASAFGLGVMVMQLDRYRAQLHSHITTTWANERPHRVLLILAALLREVRETTENRAADLRLSNSEKQRLVAITSNYLRPVQFETLDARTIHRFWHKLGESGIDICLIALADHLGTAGTLLNQDAWVALVERIRVLLQAYYEQREQLVTPPPLLDGNVLMDQLTLKPGRIIGELLDLIREGQAASEIHSLEDALRVARDYLKHHHNGTS